MEGKLLQFCKGKVTQTVVPMHQLGLVISGRKWEALHQGIVEDDQREGQDDQVVRVRAIKIK